MYDLGEIVVGCILIVSAYSLVYAVDFNNNVINKKEKQNDNNL